jgi:hypothetical protein
MANYTEIYERMIDENKKLFDEFFVVHEKYTADPIKHQKEFNEIGRTVQDVILKYEKILCGKTEGGMYSKFSRNLSEKFRDIVRKDYSKIDFIGVIRS